MWNRADNLNPADAPAPFAGARISNGKANKHGRAGSPEHLPTGITPYSSNTSGWDLQYSDDTGLTRTYEGFYDGSIYVYIITLNQEAAQ